MKDKKPEIPQMSLEFGRIERDKGLAQAIDHADESSWGWSDKAYDMFKVWIKNKPDGYEFMTEDFRVDIFGKIDDPPSLRAFGGISGRAVRDGLIEKAGYRQVKNVKAHAANAALWKKK